MVGRPVGRADESRSEGILNLRGAECTRGEGWIRVVERYEGQLLNIVSGMEFELAMRICPVACVTFLVLWTLVQVHTEAAHSSNSVGLCLSCIPFTTLIPL